MALYYCHFSRDGVRFKDRHGFHAEDHEDAIEVVTAICAILLDKDPSAGNAIVELISPAGEIALTSALRTLLRHIH